MEHRKEIAVRLRSCPPHICVSSVFHLWLITLFQRSGKKELTMSSLFGSWMLNPLLLAGGALLVAVPIVIHLLNKRKFRIIEWAAMDFLIEADQRNRRRIQIEELLLLALRCLAVLLMGLLVARPFLPSSMTSGWFEGVRHERIIVLDDSPSMSATDAGGSPFSMAKTQISDFVTTLADQAAGDSLTLVLTSKPARPLFADLPINSQTAVEVARELESLQVADRSAQIESACVDVRGWLSTRSDKINRVVYLMTDLRKGDWIGDDAGDATGKSARPTTESADAVIAAVRTLSEMTAGCFVIDLGSEATANLAIVEVAPEDKTLLAGVTTRFNVTVRNHGSQTLRDVPIKFVAGGSLPLTATLESIPAGGSASVPFSHAFAAIEGDDAVEPVELKAEIGSSGGDVLAADNVGFYAARVKAGIPTLLVDGDPSTEFGKSETFFLQRALAPPGLISSGIRVETVSASEFESRSLAAFQVVYVCNAYRLSEPRRASLEAWVAAGGGLVLWPGGQVDDRHYNDDLFRDGKGLLPARLLRVAGDESEQTFVSFSVQNAEHPSVRAFQGDAAPLLESAKLFRWWHVDDPQPDAQNPATIVLRLTDSERSAAVIEKPFGRGRVVQVNVPADTDWSNWPEDTSYIIWLQELNRYLAQTLNDRGGLAVGEPLHQPVDLSEFRPEVQITRPDGKTVTRQAVPESSELKSEISTPKSPTGLPADKPGRWGVRYDETDQRGFYKVQLTCADGQTEPTLFAANIVASESNLMRVEPSVLKGAWEGSSVQLVRGGELSALAALTAEGSRGELSLAVLLGLVGVLFVEQWLSWFFGRSR